MFTRNFNHIRHLAYLVRTVSASLLLITGSTWSTQTYATSAEVRSETIRIDSSIPDLKLALHHKFSTVQPARRPKPIVLFAEGSAVPTTGNAGFRIDGLSWMDYLARKGFDVWSLDYLGLGYSSRYPESSTETAPGRASDCAVQLESAARFILKRQRAQKLSIIGDSFGSLVAGILATKTPQLIHKLILFAPLTPTLNAKTTSRSIGAASYDFVTPGDLWGLYSSWLPKGEFAGLDRQFFLSNWGSKYLSSDPTSRQRTPPSVKVPAGPALDSADINAGRFPYDPSEITAPTLIIFGEWDSLATDEGAKRLCDLMTGTANKRRVIIGHGTHILQLESVRFVLYREVETFLKSDS
jgi:pimeloyl-ACP methyl ester carboxylesterase